jgi:hypothetical protein
MFFLKKKRKDASKEGSKEKFLKKKSLFQAFLKMESLKSIGKLIT